LLLLSEQLTAVLADELFGGSIVPKDLSIKGYEYVYVASKEEIAN